MLHIDNNLDELFKKAGENYSLKDNESAWDEIFAKTNATSSPAFVTYQKQFSKKYVIAFLLLVGLTNLFVAFPLKTNDSKNNFVSKPFTLKHSIEIANSTERQKTTSITTNNISSFNKSKSGIKNKKIVSSSKSSFRYIDINSKHINRSSVFNNPKPSLKFKLTNSLDILENQQKLVVSSAKNNSLNESEQQSIVEVKKSRKEANDTALVTTKKELKAVSAINKKGFYIGIVAGPQISQVNGQMINKVGVDIGAIIGYRFNKKFSLETGVVLSKKHYYSKGEYFKMQKVAASMPANMELISLNGTSNIVEIPLTLKYDFLNKNASNYFITAGVSSYLLTNESNDYLALVNGVKQHLQGNYNNNTKYYNATINLSVGYEHKLFKKATIKIEPYLQVPIKQMGVGSMPVSTAGIHFGVYLPLQ